MKRLHVALQVPNLDASIDFYTALFGTEPTKREADYAKWLIDDPRVNFSITERSGTGKIEHLGIQAEDEDELRELYANADRADELVYEEGDTTCCYARSEKSWARDPDGIEWEMFHTYGESQTFYGDPESACCAAEDRPSEAAV